jgi:hypothetical protein
MLDQIGSGGFGTGGVGGGPPRDDRFSFGTMMEQLAPLIGLIPGGAPFAQLLSLLGPIVAEGEARRERERASGSSQSQGPAQDRTTSAALTPGGVGFGAFA